MYIENLVLNNYRNYKELDFKLTNNVNIIYGDNAQGKTNIIESIYFCSTSKSHRTNFDKEVINWGEDEAHIQLLFYKKRQERIDIHLKKNGKKGIAINKVPIKKMSELFGFFNVVMFSPEDLSLIKNGPKQRRKFIDLELCQLDSIYVYNLQQYYKLLKQRNNLLKEINYNKNLMDTLFIWDDQLIEYGIKIIERRQEFINVLNEYVQIIHSNLTNNKEKLLIKYVKDVDIDSYRTNLKNYLKKDIKFGNTSHGPHRDDISLFINGIDVRSYGSQGQQRTVALSLKLAEIDIIKDETNDAPILLLDDVMSELDELRQKHLIEHIKDNQTIITCTGIEDMIKNISTSHIFKVDDGRLFNDI